MLDNIPKKISGLGQTAHTCWARLQYKHISSQPSSHTVTGTALTVLWWEEWQVVVMIRAKSCCFFSPQNSNRGISSRNGLGFTWFSSYIEHACMYVNVISINVHHGSLHILFKNKIYFDWLRGFLQTISAICIWVWFPLCTQLGHDSLQILRCS